VCFQRLAGYTAASAGHAMLESGGVRQGRVASACTEGIDKASNERFAVRLISVERQTLRGVLSVIEQPWDASQEAPNFQMLLSCPLADTELVATGLEGALACELGRCAAGDADESISPIAHQETSGLGLANWALGRAGPGRSGTRRRQDDEMSTSLASVSTASTFKRGGKDSIDQASLQLALGMVAAMSSQRSHPLQVFCSSAGGCLLPPKAPADEPSLVLAMTEEHLSFTRGRSTSKKDSFGVVRELSEIRQLCEDQACDEEGGSFRHSATIQVSQLSLDIHCDSPRSFAASEGDSDEELGCSDDSPSKWPSSPSTARRTRYSKLFNSASRHVAIVFDSFSARDTCLARLRAYLPMPAPSEAPSPTGAASRGHSGLLLAAAEASAGQGRF